MMAQLEQQGLLSQLSQLQRIPHDALSVGGYFAATIFLMFLFNFARGNKLADGFERVGGLKQHSFSLLSAKYHFLTGGKELLFGAMKKLQQAFYVCMMEGPVIILPGKYVNEVKNNRSLSSTEYFKKAFFVDTPGFEANGLAFNSSVLKDTVRTKLTQALGPVSTTLCEQTDESVQQLYGDSPEWQEMSVPKHVNKLVAMVSTRIFSGPELVHNEEWLRITVDYTINMMIAVRSMKLLPTFLQPYLHWFVPHAIWTRRDRTSARKIIGKEITRRDAERQKNYEMGIPPPKFGDSIGWMAEVAKGEPYDLAGGQLTLTVAAIHTTSDVVAKTLYYIAANPDVADALRQEAVDILTTEGWKKTSLTKMRFVDSLMKEVQRLYPAGLINMPRYAVDDVHFKDGTKIPKNQMTAVLTDAMRDPKIYDDPETFDAWRFVKLAKETGDNNHWQFVTTSAEHFGFGHGIHACPGRFFAANEIKIILVFLVLKYEWRVVDLEKRLAAGREPALCIGSDCILDPKLRLEYRRRKEEVDPIKYCEPPSKA